MVQCNIIEEATNFLLLCAIFIMSIYLLWQHFNPPGLPPGPVGLPGIGVLPSLGPTPYKALMELSKTYGDVMSLRLGPTLVVVLSGRRAMTEALVKKSDFFSDRPSLPLLNLVHKGRGLMVAKYGPKVHGFRTLLLGTFRRLGVNTPRLDGLLRPELAALVDSVDQQGGQPTDPKALLSISASNMICTLAFGKRFDYDDANFQNFLRKLNNIFEISSSPLGFLTLNIPAIVHLPISAIKDTISDCNFMLDFLRAIVDERWLALVARRRSDPNIAEWEDPSDLLDGYLRKIGCEDAVGMSVSNEDIAHHFLDLFTAGTESVSHFLQWELLYLTTHPEAQAKAHEELDRVVGRARLPSVNDRPNMPYMRALLEEVHRVSSFSPLGIPRMTADIVDIDGYIIPKETMVFSSIWDLHKDPEKWENPDSFDPSRFLDTNGQVNESKLRQLQPFGLGE
ncbi:cytochrome P450 2U1-like [Branchiostoma lanceolatum]|uniref:cytochrome P450 2U1-like n=1 Tax=Branchiostoma lanceolatum TaxID=7740 RepID=UPI003454BBCC